MLKKSSRKLHRGALESLLSPEPYAHMVKFHKAGQEMTRELEDKQLPKCMQGWEMFEL